MQGIGFGHVPGGADPVESGDAPSGLASHFRKATDVASKDMAQEKISARDRIRARIQDALHEKSKSQRKEGELIHCKDSIESNILDQWLRSGTQTLKSQTVLSFFLFIMLSP